MTLTQKYADWFGGPPEFVVRAPGRVNLIGEHTDYNDGFVFPAAIDFDVQMAGSPRPDGQVRAYSTTFDQMSTFALSQIESTADAKWSNYIRGVVKILQSDGKPVRGMNVVVEGTVPISSGLSSSAAMEVAACLAFEAAGGFAIDPVQRALIGQRAEREFVGVNVGIMDQFISANGRAHHALLLDTRSLEFELVPLPDEDVAIVVGDTNKPRGLVDSEYNTRRSECEKAVAILQSFSPGVKALRDVEQQQLSLHKADLPDTVFRRARHVVSENARVLQSVAALKAGELGTFGLLMNDSHDSLRDDYEVSCLELDAMVDAARKVDGVFGARMTGAGFGGCTVSLVRSDAVDDFRERVGREYHAVTGIEATFYICHASDGASRI